MGAVDVPRRRAMEVQGLRRETVQRQEHTAEALQIIGPREAARPAAVSAVSEGLQAPERLEQALERETPMKGGGGTSSGPL